jgi:hypothetical protein
MAPGKSSPKEIKIMIPAENPTVKLMNPGPGFLITSPRRLPIIVESPAPNARSNAGHIQIS